MPIRIQNDLPAKEILEKENTQPGDPTTESRNPESDAAEGGYRASASQKFFQYTIAGGCDIYYSKQS